MQPLVSVVIPVYNSAATLLESLRSVLEQTHRHLEVLIVDDGSTDDSLALCRSVDDPRIRIVTQANRGLAGARNTGIRHASGAFVGFIDSDDLWLPTKVERHLEHFARSPAVGLSFSRSSFIDDAGRPLGIYQLPRLQDITPRLLFCRNPISNGSCVLMRREVLDAIAFTADLHGAPETFWFDDSFRQSEDVECWMRIALTTDWIIEGIPEALTLYRVSSGGLSANVEKQAESWERVIAKIESYAPEFIARWGNRARAYHLRYLARRATQLRLRGLAVSLFNRAMLRDWHILVEEPRRTLITCLAAYLLWILPPPLYRWLERRMIRVTGSSQKRRIDRESAGSSPRAPGGRGR